MADDLTFANVTAVAHDPFAGPVLTHVAPTTEPQAEIWLACQLGGDDANRAYNESISLLLDGPLDRDAFGRAWRALLDRHEALRSAFSADGRTMCVFETVAAPLIYHDYSGDDAASQQRRVADWLAQEAQHVFDLQNGPLVRAGLLKLSATEHRFTLTAHHLICDGWSTGVLLQDLGRLYSAYVRYVPPDLPKAPLFSRYAAGQRVFYGSDAYRRLEQYWLNQFAGAVPQLNLPTDTERPARRTYAGRRQDYSLDPALVQAVRQAGLRAGCSFVTTLTAAVELLLRQWTHQETIVLGLPAAGQPVASQDGLVGHCVHLLPLKSRADVSGSFADYLRQRKAALTDAYEHQFVTFGSLLKKLSVQRDPSRVPLVPVVFNVDMGLDNGVRFEGLVHRLLSNPRAYEHFELALNATGHEGALVLEWSYNTHLFRAETVAALHARFVELLATVSAAPDAPLNVLKFGGTPGAADTVAPRPLHADKPSLTTLLSATARQYPHKTAVRFRGLNLTYRALNERANQLAAYLQSRGVRPGDRVGFMVERSAELIVGLLAVLKTGAAYVPIDPQHPADRVTYMLTDAACRVALVSASFRSRVTVPLELIELETIWPALDTYPVTDAAIVTSGADLAYVLYTSGTTGRPKGVLTKHHGIVNVLRSVQQQPGFGPDDVTAALATVAFDLSTVEIYLPLLTGATLVLADSATTRNGEALARLLADEGVTFLQATPATYRMLWESGWRGGLHLTLISCAEALPNDLARKLLSTNRALWNFYGPTETTIYATGGPVLTDERITIGRAIANTRIFLLDETQQPVGPGQTGEIGIVGDGLAGGYLNQPALTAEKFVSVPGVDTPGPNVYRTGDLGRLTPNGDLEYLGRMDQQVKIRGYRIELAEIEHHLLRQPGVVNAVVVAREDRPGDQRLVAYVVGDAQPTDADARIRAWRDGLRRMLPEYMLPGAFVLLEALPVTANGKIDKKALPVPAYAQPTDADPAPGPRPAEDRSLSAEETVLAAIWKDVLGLATVRSTDNFFALGGHSLIAVQVMARLQKQTGRRLPLSTLFEYPTIEALAGLLRAGVPVSTHKSLVPIRPQGSKVPIYVIHGIGLNLLNFSSLTKYMDPDQPIYGLQARGLDGTEEPLDNMEAIAACYLAEVLEQNPTGPYALAGYSFGGYVAYEMARQLLAMGREVKMLAMFDTNAQELVIHRTRAGKLLRKLGRQFPKALWIGRSLIQHPATTLRYQRDYVRRHVDGLLRATGLRPEPQPAGELAHMDHIIEKHEVAYQNYVLRPYDGTLDLFRATTRVYFVDDPRYLGWKDYARRGVRVHDVPGDHETLMHPPNDKALALALQRALDNR